MTKPKVVFLFPGQGAQYVGMGKDFYEHFSVAKEIFQWGEDLLQQNITKILFEGPLETLTQTRYSQVAIYLCSMAACAVLKEQFPQLVPSACMGLSLGEYSALCMSQYLPFERCLPLVFSRGNYMHEACETYPGTMAALFGIPAEEVTSMVEKIPDLWVANLNSPGQTVISGTIEGIEKGIEEAKRRNAKRVIPLKVHGAFHSGLMRLAQDKLEKKIEQESLDKGTVPLVMNVSGHRVTDPQEILENLIKQVTHPVQWQQSIQSVEDDVDLFIEVGCGQVLAGLNRRLVKVPTISIDKKQDLDLLATYGV